MPWQGYGGWILACTLFTAVGCGAQSTIPQPSVDGGQTDGASTHTDGAVSTTDSATGNDVPVTPQDTGVLTDSGPATGSNVVPAVVDDGPNHLGTIDELYISVTFCRPGTTICQTVDHIMVDTGSSGLRVIASVLDPSLMLPNQNAPSGGTLLECSEFADGYTWGPVATADIQVGGESASNVAIQVIGDPSFGSVPRDCASAGSSEDTVQDFGGNGLIGIGTTVADCGDYCADPSDPQPGDYYACTGPSCSIAVVPSSQQVLNPVTLFPTDNNGTVVQLPAVDPSGEATVTGSLIFGIGTQGNNALNGATVLTVDTLNGYFTTSYNGMTLSQSFIDSGSNAYYFTDNSIPQCTSRGGGSGFDCPASTLSLSAQNIGGNGMVSSVTFLVGNANSIFGSGDNTAFDDLAATGFMDGSFDWGLPFFFGKSIFTAIAGASTPGGTGPYFAY